MNLLTSARPRTRAALLSGACVFFIVSNLALLPRHYLRDVDVETVQPAALPLTVRAFGFIDAKASQTLHAEFEAPVLEKKFREGDVVHKGQVLVILGRDKIKLEFRSKQDAYENAQSDLARARKDLRLQRALFEKQAVAFSSVDDARRTLVRAQQALDAAREAFRQTQLTWDHNVLVAPFDGTITKDSLLDDPSVASGRDIVTVSDVSEYHVAAHIDELESRRIQLQQAADVRLSVYDGRHLKAVVMQIGAAQQNNGVTEVPVVLALTDIGDLKLQPKLSAEVRIQTGATGPVLSVPLTALANAEGVSRVWRMDALHRLRSSVVTLGASNPDRTEISQGLRPGDRICVNADPAFTDGMQIRLRAHANPA